MFPKCPPRSGQGKYRVTYPFLPRLDNIFFGFCVLIPFFIGGIFASASCEFLSSPTGDNFFCSLTFVID